MLKEKKQNFKVSIIGVGSVGSSIAYALMLKNLASEIVLIDKNTRIAVAEQLDLSCNLKDICECNIYAGDYRDIRDSDVIVMTCGRGRKPNETRLDMVNENIKITEIAVNDIKKYYNKGIVLIVSNPLDIITYKMIQWLDLPKEKVFGTGCALDSLRFCNVIAEFIGKENDCKIDAMMIGEHGESQVPLWSKVKIDNIPIENYCKNKKIRFNEEIRRNLAKQVVTMGANIISGKGRTNYGIATCASYIVDIIKNDKKQILSVSSALYGEYGLENLALSLPSVIGKHGVEKICIESLSPLESEQLYKSSDIIRSTLNVLKDEAVALLK